MSESIIKKVNYTQNRNNIMVDCCNESECTRIADFICDCIEEESELASLPVKLCSKHAEVHAQRPGCHNICRYIQQNKLNKKLILHQCINSLSMIQSLRRQVLDNTNQAIRIIMDQSAKDISLLRNMDDVCNSIVEYLKSK